MLHWLARNALQELAALGHTALTPDEIAELHDAATAIDHIQHTHSTPIGAGIPVTLGHTTLWPLTCAAADFWERAARWYPASPRLLTHALAYALAHGRQPGAFDALTTPALAEPAIRAFARTLACTPAELDRAIDLLTTGARLTRADELQKALATLTPHLTPPELETLTDRLLPPPPPPNHKTWHQIVVDFCTLTGTHPDPWLLQPTAEIARAYALALTVANPDPAAPTPTRQALAAATRTLRQIIKRIHESRQTP